MTDVPIPYTPTGTPIYEKIEGNGITFLTANWKVPKGVEYKGIIVYVHGFGEYAVLYTEVFDKLSQQGYEIFFFDQRGSGDTSPGDLVGVTDEYHTFNDLDFIVKTVLDRREDKTEKVFVGGHSMGGGIVLNYAIKGKYRDHVRGIFVSGPLITLNPKSDFSFLTKLVLPLFNYFFPNFRFDSNIKYEYLTSSEGYGNYIKAHDKLIGTVRQMYDMIGRGKRLLGKEYASKFPTSIPLIILHGTNDNINYIESSKKFISILPDGVEKEFVPVENARHSLFIENETIFKGVFNRVVKFLNTH